jgi:hypothetical protein
MKTVSFLISIVFAFVLLNQFTPGNVVAQTENFLTYTNTNYGFTIKYPSDWNVDDSNTTGMGVLFGSGATAVQVWRIPSPIPTALWAEHGFIFHILPLGFRLTELNTNTYFLSGHPAIRVTGIKNYPQGGDREVMMTTTGTYTVNYWSPAETYLTYLPIAQQMIDSFQVINAQRNQNTTSG